MEMKARDLMVLALGIIGLCVLGGCASNHKENNPSATTVTINGFASQGTIDFTKTGKFETFTYDTNYSISNNTWGMGINGSGTACTFKETVNGSSAFGWFWDVTGTGVVIYPEVGYGWTPNGAQIWAGNPVIPRISEGKNITVDFAVKSQYSSDGTWNLAFDIWLTPTQHPTSTKPGYEIMVWLDHNKQGPWANGAAPARVTIDGVTYDAYTNEGRDGGWIVLSYINVGSAIYNKTGFNLSNIVNDAVSRFGVPTSEYVNAIEFGNEVITGSGMTEITKWKVNIQ
jgi:hypothetical protein